MDRILAGEDLQARRPWAIQPDGDLWQIADDLVEAKGPNPLKVTWCKGHATDEHITNGQSSPYLKKGNDIVDILASKGVECEDGISNITLFLCH